MSFMKVTQRRYWPAAGLATLLCVASVGCFSSSDSTLQVRGTVTYQGAPVPGGSIVFEPDADAGNRGPGVAAQIRDGRYETTYGKGIGGGAYVVKITGNDGQPFINDIGEEYAGQPTFATIVRKVEFPQESTTHDFALP